MTLGTKAIFENIQGVKSAQKIRTHHIKVNILLVVYLQMEDNQEIKGI
jgi:hypothetical protein